MATTIVLKTTTTKPAHSKAKMEAAIAKKKNEAVYNTDGTKREGGVDKKATAQWKAMDKVYRDAYKNEIKADDQKKADKYGKHIQAGENIAATKEGRKAVNVDGSGSQKKQAVATRKEIDNVGLDVYNANLETQAETNRSTFNDKKYARITKNNNGQGMN